MRRRLTRLVPGPAIVMLAGLLVALAVVGGSRGPGRADAQDPVATAAGTPAAFSLPVVPLLEECRVPPRVSADLAGLSATPMTIEELAPATPPPGLDLAPPADEATTLAVLAVVRQSIACSNAGDLARGFALVTDGYLRRRIIAVVGPFDQATLDAIATPSLRPENQQITFVSASVVVFLPDGRAAVEVVASDVRTRRSLALLVQTPAGWRIDELIPLEDSPAPPATPAATPGA